MSEFVKKNGLLCELVKRAEYYLDFEIDDITGEALSETRMEARHYDRISRLQRDLFNHIENGNLETSLKTLVMTHVSGISNRQHCQVKTIAHQRHQRIKAYVLVSKDRNLLCLQVKPQA